MKKHFKNKDLSAEQLNAKKLRIRFLILVIISGSGAILTMHLATGAPLFIPWGFICFINILTFLISGFGLLTNLF